MLHQDGEEGDDEVEDDKAGGEVVGEAPERQNQLQGAVGGELLMAGEEEDDEDDPVVQVYLQQQLQVFLHGDLTFAHEVSRDHQKTVDARFPPHAEEPQEDGVPCVGVAKERGSLLHKAGVDHIVVRYNHEHADDTVKLKVRASGFLRGRDACCGGGSCHIVLCSEQCGNPLRCSGTCPPGSDGTIAVNSLQRYDFFSIHCFFYFRVSVFLT